MIPKGLYVGPFLVSHFLIVQFEDDLFIENRLVGLHSPWIALHLNDIPYDPSPSPEPL